MKSILQCYNILIVLIRLTIIDRWLSSASSHTQNVARKIYHLNSGKKKEVTMYKFPITLFIFYFVFFMYVGLATSKDDLKVIMRLNFSFCSYDEDWWWNHALSVRMISQIICFLDLDNWSSRRLNIYSMF